MEPRSSGSRARFVAVSIVKSDRVMGFVYDESHAVSVDTRIGGRPYADDEVEEQRCRCAVETGYQ